MKIILNIIIVILIGLLSSTYLFDFSPIDYRDSIKNENTENTKNTIRLMVKGTTTFSNPKSIVVSHISDNDETIISVSENIFSANIYKNNKLILENINNLELVSILTENSSLTINKDNPLLTTIDISQDKLGLDDGKYKIVLESNLINNPNNRKISLDVTYDTKGFYISALSTAPINTKGLTLYFTNENADILIPVTRFVVEDKSITRMAIEQLQNGPIDNHMKTVIGNVTNCTYNNGNVVIDIPSSYEQYNQGSTGSTLAYDAFVKTIFRVSRYWPIHSVSFTVDRKNIDTYFHGIDVKSPILRIDNNYVFYLANKVDDRYYLIEKPTVIDGIDIKEEDMLEVKVQKFFQSCLNLELDNHKNPIPKDLILQNVTVDKNILQLDFNDIFLKSYTDKDDLKLMMIDSLVYTFTSVPTINGIKITINNKPLTNFVKDKDLSGVLTKAEFINPEKAE